AHPRDRAGDRQARPGHHRDGLGRRPHAGGHPLAHADGQDLGGARAARTGAAALFLRADRSDHRGRHRQLRDAGRRDPRRAARAHRLRRPPRHRRDDPPAAARRVPALRIPPRARSARPHRRAARAQGHAAPPARLLRRPADAARMTYAEALGPLIARLDASVFEATTALALDHFAREGVEVAVLEVGLGGRYDSTTVGTPAVSVLTSIDLDHQEYLGHTLREIATDKAHIIRAGVAISAAQAPEAAAVIAARAATVGVPLLREGHELGVAVRERTLAGQRLDCAGPTFKLDDLRIRLLGTYQPGNTLLAVAAARALD